MWISAIEKTTLANKACYHRGRPGWRSALKLPNWLGEYTSGKSYVWEWQQFTSLRALKNEFFCFFLLGFCLDRIAIHTTRYINFKSFSLWFNIDWMKKLIKSHAIEVLTLLQLDYSSFVESKAKYLKWKSDSDGRLRSLSICVSLSQWYKRSLMWILR